MPIQIKGSNWGIALADNQGTLIKSERKNTRQGQSYAGYLTAIWLDTSPKKQPTKYENIDMLDRTVINKWLIHVAFHKTRVQSLTSFLYEGSFRRSYSR